MPIEVERNTAISFNAVGATLQGKRGLVVGTANEQGIATGCAEAGAVAWIGRWGRGRVGIGGRPPADAESTMPFKASAACRLERLKIGG
jgi:hypothetical protein